MRNRPFIPVEELEQLKEQLVRLVLDIYTRKSEDFSDELLRSKHNQLKKTVEYVDGCMLWL